MDRLLAGPADRRLLEPGSKRAPARVAILAILVLSILTACGSNEFDGYEDANPSDRAAITATVLSYYELRNASVPAGATDSIWRAYPGLSKDRAPNVGINAEAEFLDGMSRGGVERVITEPEEREPMRILVKADRAVAFVHGRETWLRTNSPNTVGEIRTVLYLSRTDQAAWTITKTDEMYPGEPLRTPPSLSSTRTSKRPSRRPRSSVARDIVHSWNSTAASQRSA